MSEHSSGTDTPAPPGFRWVYTTHYRHWRSGKVIYAADYGYEAFRFLVPCKGR